MGADLFLGKDLGRLGRAHFYGLAGASGLLTTIAAGTATAGHLFAARFVSASKIFLVTRLRFKWETIAGFTAAQEVALAAFLLTGYSAAHTGGTALTVRPKHSSYDAGGLAARIGDTGALTAGTHTVGDLLGRGAFAELAAGAAVPKGFVDEELIGDELHPLAVLASNSGLLIRNEVLGGAGGTGRLTVEIDGYERTA